jgi:hypothetical protein
VARVCDLTLGWVSGTSDHKTVLPRLADPRLLPAERVCQEPKIKWCIEIGADHKTKATNDLGEVTQSVSDDLFPQ